jgi:hypothetical protein
MAGIAGISGRPKSEARNYKETHELIKLKAPGIAQMLIDKAINDKDRDAAMYLLDRVYGKPKQSNETKIDIELHLSPELLLLHRRNAELRDQQLLDAIPADYEVMPD